MLKSFENIDIDDIQYLTDIVFSFSESKFEGKIFDYDPNKYFGYMIRRRSFQGCFLWTFDYHGDEEDLLHGLYLYKDNFSKLTGFKIHHILFDDGFVLLTFLESNSDICKFSIKFVKSSFSDPNIKEILLRRLYEPVSYNNYNKDDLMSGIMYRNGNCSNLSLFDWKYKNHKSKTL